MNVCVFVCVQESVSLCEVVLCVSERERLSLCEYKDVCAYVYMGVKREILID